MSAPKCSFIDLFVIAHIILKSRESIDKLSSSGLKADLRNLRLKQVKRCPLLDIMLSKKVNILFKKNCRIIGVISYKQQNNKQNRIIITRLDQIRKGKAL